MAKKPSTSIRVPVALRDRLVRLADDILAAKESAHGYDDVPLTEQGQRGIWVPLAAVIARALDEFESHRKRARLPRARQDPQPKRERKP